MGITEFTLFWVKAGYRVSWREYNDLLHVVVSKDKDLEQYVCNPHFTVEKELGILHRQLKERFGV
jgi:hypothetical protein